MPNDIVREGAKSQVNMCGADGDGEWIRNFETARAAVRDVRYGITKCVSGGADEGRSLRAHFVRRRSEVDGS